MAKQIFITGTDTGVGKTTVSEALAFILKQKGHSVGYFKPVETGCEKRCEDAYSLSKITNQNLDEILCYSFKEPLAPLVAERLENKKINIEKIKTHFENLKEKYEYLIVEGAGGILVPITEQNGKIYTYLDLLKMFNIPSVIVSRAGLGTINHTTLTVRVMKDLEIKGIIMNGFSRNPDISQKTNPQIIEEMTKIPVIAKILEGENPFEESIKNLKKIIWKIFE